MSKPGEVWRRLGMLVQRGKFDQELDEEMRAHREMKERELAARGIEGGQARYAANRAFGNPMALTERGRDAWGWRWLDDFLRDLRFGLRMLRKNSGFAATAVLTLALGIGANTAIFSVVNAVLLKPLPYRDPGKLVWADEYWPRMSDYSVLHPDYTNWYLNNQSFESIGAFGGTGPVNLTGAGEPERIDNAAITPSLLDTLGVRPALGRGFTAEEGRPGGNPVAILSDALWKRKFGGDATIVGKGIVLNQQTYTVVGVMPAEFHFPDRGVKPELLLPFQLPLKVDWTVPRMSLTRVIGRLKPGVTLAQADADLAMLSKRTEADIPAMFAPMRSGVYVSTLGLHDKLVGDVRPTLVVLLAAVGVVLLIACVNIANLQLARTANRQKELTVRAAIGASRTRLLRQLLAEGALIAFLGGLLGLAGAVAGVRLLQSYAPASFLQVGSIAVDKWVLLFTLNITCLTVLLFGAIPAFRASKPDVDTKLKDGRDFVTSGTGHRKLRGALVVSELALAVVLLAASGLLIRSFVLLSNVDPGFDARGLLTVITALPQRKYSEPTQRKAFFDQVLRKLKGMPGVRSAGLTTSLPLTNFNMRVGFSLEGHVDDPSAPRLPTAMENVSPEYFSAMRVPLLAGRFFDEHDCEPFDYDAPNVIVNQAFVQRYLANEEAVGTKIRFAPTPNAPWGTIVGVVGNTRHARLDREADPEIYVPFTGGLSMGALTVRTDADPRTLASAVRDLVLEVDPEQPVFNMITMEQRIADAASGTRFNATLLGFFGFVALVLAAVGVYGVIAYSVAERTHEIGIRVALGASRHNVAGMVMGQGMVMTVAGLVLGLAGAVFATRFLLSLLYGTQPRDPMTLGTAAVVLAVVALTACWVPTWRAMRVDPMVSLRHE